MNPLDEGRSLYRKKDYDGAIKAFTKAVRVTTDSMRLTALDHRAATHEKLNQLQHALKDARDMIELRPGAAKGYLRCGKVLQLKGKDDVALRIYEQGLKRVKADDDPDRSLIHGMHRKLQIKLQPAKTLDPLIFLPAEIAQMVCQNLSLRDLVVCLRISKGWKRFLESVGNLWMALEIRHLRTAPSQAALKAYLRRSKFAIERAVCEISSRGLDEKKLTLLVKYCKNLAHLELFPARNRDSDSLAQLAKHLRGYVQHLPALRYLDVSIDAPWDHILKILGHCPQLEVGKFAGKGEEHFPNHIESWPNMPRLHTFQVRSLSAQRLPVPFHSPQLSDMCSAMPCLRSLALQALCWFEQEPEPITGWKLEALDLHLSTLMPIILPATLRHLDISNTSIPSGIEAPLFDALPQLEHFDCTGSQSLRDSSTIQRIVAAASKNSTLKRLYMGQSGNYHTLANIREGLTPFQPCDSLEELKIDEERYNDDSLAAIAAKFPNLRRLDCSKNDKMTGVAIKSILELCPKLEWINIQDCNKISRDAVDYAINKGVRVKLFKQTSAKQPSSYLSQREVW